ncbi:hypothetical protein FYJ24_09300 [Actinomycetaceae bacterium WB03_NA08]|uniref:Uncharacterized protein n=1 Tax=Scrofimicrobium canadense TaxID=2652290 RepID=A0A6N7VT45_9ACTO|nr:hypothetical protein [Scrofimicrobium canadense]MSS84954.1 hypothetical protein [Scrofimicrobium canadense]
MDENGKEGNEALELRLSGKRFENGHLPIDSLADLERYQRLVRSITIAKWTTANPEEEVPKDLSEIGLSIARIDEGSVVLPLLFTPNVEYVDYQLEAAQAVETAFVEIYDDNGGMVILPPEMDEEDAEALAGIGRTLLPDEKLTVTLQVQEESRVVVIDSASRERAEERMRVSGLMIVEDDEVATVTENSKLPGKVCGKITALDTDAMRYRLKLPTGETINGLYKNAPTVVDDLRDAIDKAEEGPVVRISGTLHYKDEMLWRVWQTDEVEVFDSPEISRRGDLERIALLGRGWDGEDAPAISFVALEVAGKLLQDLPESTQFDASIFPDEGSGLLIEWANAQRVLSVEVDAAGRMIITHLPEGKFETYEEETANVADAVKFVREVLS